MFPLIIIAILREKVDTKKQFNVKAYRCHLNLLNNTWKLKGAIIDT
jgi:hypothetical protein